VTEVHVWLTSWEHECRGDQRKVGDTVSVALSFDGSVEATDPNDHFEPL
jgi:hypothetical protein